MNVQLIDRLNITQDQKAELKRLLFRPGNEGGNPARGLSRLAELVPAYAAAPEAAPSHVDTGRSLVRLGLTTARRLAALMGDARDAQDLAGAGELVDAALQHDAPDFGKLAQAVKGAGVGCRTLKFFCELATGKPAAASKGKDDDKGDDKKK